MDEQLTQVFFAYLAGNRTPDGKPPDYGIYASKVSGDQSKIDLTLVFKKGVQYCCVEPACHLGFFTKNSWQHFRKLLDQAGITILFPMVIHLKGIVEEGALIEMEPHYNVRSISKRFEYEHDFNENAPLYKKVSQEPPPNYTGFWTIYDADGRKEKEITYVNGIREGKVKHYGGHGGKIREFYLVNALRHGIMTQWNSQGEVIDVSEWDNGTGIYRIYNSRGQLAWEQQVRHGKRHGILRRWINGVLQYTEYYDDGKLLQREN